MYFNENIPPLQEGILLVNKPTGPTSHDIVDLIRKKTGVRRVGHAGTLDPFAQGLLIILIGKEFTKRQSEFLGMDKTYKAVIHLGATSTTDDRMGEITLSSFLDPRLRGDDKRESGHDKREGWDDKKENENSKIIIPNLTDIQKVLTELTGTYEQLPPSYSAKKIQGKKAYELARKGIIPELKPKKITVYSLDILSYEWPLLTIRTTVSSGTYIRALARDIGARLGCGAYCESLKRTAIGPYTLDKTIDISILDKKHSL